jgi:hypothetical protein
VAALGPLTLGLLTSRVYADKPEPMRYAGVTMCLVFLVGLATLPFAPETKGKPLPNFPQAIESLRPVKNIDGDRVLRNVANSSRAEALLLTISRTDGLEDRAVCRNVRSMDYPQPSVPSAMSASRSNGYPTSIFRCSLEYAARKSTGAPRQDGLDSGIMHRGELMARMKKVVITACGDESKLAIVESDLPDPVVGEV